VIRSSSDVPARPDARAGAARRVRTWLPTGLVSLVMSVTVLGGFVVGETLPQPDVTPVVLGGVLTVRPLPGWEVVRRDEIAVPAPSGGSLAAAFAQLTRGSGALDVVALPGIGGEALQLADLYAGEVLSGQLERLALSDRVDRIVLRSGLEAVRFGYIGSERRSGAAVEGSVTAVVAPSGSGAVFDGWAFEGQLELIAEELVAMIERAQLT
jgi:hypothetical protein